MSSSANRPDFVEEFFFGIAAAAYNYVGSVAFLMSRPYRGPRWLAASRLRPTTAQIAPQTIILVTIIVLHWMPRDISAGIQHGLQSFLIQRTVSESLAAMVLRAVWTTVTIDIVVKAVARALEWRNRARRQRIATTLAYAYAVMLTYVAVFLFIADRIVRLAPNWAEIAAVVITGGVIPLPITMTLYRFVTVRSKRARAFSHAVVALLAFSILFAGAAGARTVSRWARNRADPMAELGNLRCSKPVDGAITATFVIRNPRGEAVVVHPSALQLRLELAGIEKPLQLSGRIVRSGVGDDLPLYVIAPGDTVWFQLRTVTAELLIDREVTPTKDFCSVVIPNDLTVAAKPPKD